MDTMYHMMGYEVQTAQIDNPPRPITFGPTKTKDGFIIIAPISQLNFETLARAARHPEWLEGARLSTVLGGGQQLGNHDGGSCQLGQGT